MSVSAARPQESLKATAGLLAPAPDAILRRIIEKERIAPQEPLPEASGSSTSRRISSTQHKSPAAARLGLIRAEKKARAMQREHAVLHGQGVKRSSLQSLLQSKM
jgi:hypothetical protein